MGARKGNRTRARIAIHTIGTCRTVLARSTRTLVNVGFAKNTSKTGRASARKRVDLINARSAVQTHHCGTLVGVCLAKNAGKARKA